MDHKLHTDTSKQFDTKLKAFNLMNFKVVNLNFHCYEIFPAESLSHGVSGIEVFLLISVINIT